MRKPAIFNGHPMPFVPHEVRGVVQYVVDGDTFDVMVDEGFYDYAYITVRLLDFDAPEIRTSNAAEKVHGQQATAFLRELLTDRQVKLRTYKDNETFGRFVADVWFWTGAGWVDVVATLREAGFERRASY